MWYMTRGARRSMSDVLSHPRLLLRRTLFGGFGRALLEHALFRAVVPPDQILLVLLGGQACGLDRPVGLDLGPGTAHQLFGAAGDQQGQTELAVHTFGYLLNHVAIPSNEILCGCVPDALPGGPVSAFWPEPLILTQDWPDSDRH